jgi:hypothetical protein
MSIRDTDEIVQNAKDPEKKTGEPERNTEDHEVCKCCGELIPLNGRCPTCGMTREDVDKNWFKKFHDSGKSGF